MLKHFRSCREQGDTIVEVLISIAIVSVILGGAYVVSNTSLQATRSAQEQSNALKIAQSQIEEIKSMITNKPDNIYGGSAPTTFCIANITTIVATSVANPDSQCIVTNPGSTQPQYTLTIVRTNNDFNLKVSWFDVNGKNSDQLQVVYRDYK